MKAEKKAERDWERRAVLSPSKGGYATADEESRARWLWVRPALAKRLRQCGYEDRQIDRWLPAIGEPAPDTIHLPLVVFCTILPTEGDT